jgi:type I restriction enzyme S subunit
MATENKKYIPALRFPEFQNNGEWNYEYGNMLYDSIVNKKHKSDLPILAITQDNGAIPRDEINYRVIVNDKSIEGYKIVEIGDFIISLRSFQGGIEYSRYKGLCSPAYIVLRKKHSKICDDFYRHYFKSFQYIQALNRNLEGIRDGKMVSYKQFSDIKLPCPSLAEQKKIADCLSSLDKYIDATKRKLELLKEHKKGLMQRLFPAKGKTTPELRFPEFQNDGEWNYEYGNMLYDSIVNKKHKSDLPILAITQENGAIPRDEINYQVVVEDKSIEGYKVVEIGDFIISLRSFQGGIEYSRYKGLCSPAYIVLRKRHSKICDDFYRHYFKSFQYIQELNRNLEGIRDGKMVSYKQFADIQLPNPSYEEQCKIAKVLSSIDDVIQTHIEKISALELHKNGLMQQLFPKL